MNCNSLLVTTTRSSPSLTRMWSRRAGYSVPAYWSKYRELQSVRVCGLLPNCELADDLPSLLPVADLSNVNDYLRRHH